MLCAALQFDIVCDEPLRNLESARALIEQAAERGVQLAVLPELWPCSFSPGLTPELREASAACVAELQRLSKQHGIALAGSSHGIDPPQESGEESAPPPLPTNRYQIFSQGELLSTYDKVHLFTPTAEHLGFRCGEQAPPVVQVAEAKVSGLICYDLRFPEICRAPIRAGAELLLFSAQWPSPRASHWRHLLIGRAVEGQCFIIGSNRCGTALIGRRKMELEFLGNSMIVAPDGSVLAEGTREPGMICAEIDFEQARSLRKQVPVLDDERRDLHASW